jgi:ribonuclease BN (tRNA processing enzyme)
MKIEVLGCYGGEAKGYRLTCLLINDRVALDAGSLTQSLPVDRQVEVGNIVVSHSHVDHTASIPFLIDNVFGRREEALQIYTSEATGYTIRRYLFNDATWPDFTRLPNHLEPVVNFHEIKDAHPFELHGVRFTPIPVNHPVPTHGFLIEHGGKSILWSSDTGPTQRLWEVANNAKNLQAVCVDTSFHNAMQDIADISGHLTPASLERELEKLEQKVPVLLHHLKPACVEPLRREVAKLGNPDIDYLEQGRIYEF